MRTPQSLSFLFEGWDGYQTSLVRAITPLMPAQLEWRPAEGRRRILSHDSHHGGQIAMMLAIQGIEAFELRAMGGHIVECRKIIADC